MDLRALLLLVAFRHTIEGPDLDSGLTRVAAIAGQDLDLSNLHAALSDFVAQGYIRDPVQLRPGALHCQWRLELTTGGVEQVQKLLQANKETADELLAHIYKATLQ